MEPHCVLWDWVKDWLNISDIILIHYDHEYARKHRLPDIIVNGRFKIAILSQLITNWIGSQGFIRKLEASHRGMDIVCDPITCRGVIKKKYIENDEQFVELEIWIENRDGKVTTPGSALIILANWL